MMRSWIELNQQALRNNYQNLAREASHAVFVPVLKANAYGHGLKEVLTIIQPLRPSWIGVNYLDEAKELRDNGYKGRILILGPMAQSEYVEASGLSCDVFVAHEAALKVWQQLVVKPKAHIKFDTGMSRQGFLPGEADKLAKELLPYREHIAGVCSHFSNVEDVLEHSYAEAQMKRFGTIREAFRKQKYEVMFHIGASASTLILKDSVMDLVRVGISLYGHWPSAKTRLSYMQQNNRVTELQPVMSWRTEVAALKTVSPGEYIGYGCTYRAVQPMRVAVLPIGYYEGYPRIAGNNHSYVLIHGQRCPLVGRICMNMMMVDVTHVPQVAINDVVTLIGQDQQEYLDATTVAEWAQTIHYELLTRILAALPRRIV